MSHKESPMQAKFDRLGDQFTNVGGWAMNGVGVITELHAVSDIIYGHNEEGLILGLSGASVIAAGEFVRRIPVIRLAIITKLSSLSVTDNTEDQ